MVWCRCPTTTVPQTRTVYPSSICQQPEQSQPSPHISSPSLHPPPQISHLLPPFPSASLPITNYVYLPTIRACCYCFAKPTTRSRIAVGSLFFSPSTLGWCITFAIYLFAAISHNSATPLCSYFISYSYFSYILSFYLIPFYFILFLFLIYLLFYIFFFFPILPFIFPFLFSFFFPFVLFL